MMQKGQWSQLGALGVLVLALAAVSVSAPSCKDGAQAPDVGDLIPDSAIGPSCDAEPNEWRIGDLTLPSRDDAGSQANLFDIWGIDENAIWAVGSEGAVLFYNGEKWTRQKTPTMVQLTSVWGTDINDVWAAGFGGTVLHFDGTTWTDVPVPTDVFMEQVPDAGAPTGDAAAEVRQNLWGIWAAGRDGVTDELWAVGDRGTVLHYDGVIWTRIDSEVEEKLSGVWAPRAGKVFIVGDFGTILVGDQSGLAKQRLEVDDPAYEKFKSKALRAVWGRGGSDIYAVGLSGAIFHFNGNNWLLVGGAPPQMLRDVWGPPGSQTTYILGWDGLLMRMNGRRGADVTFDLFNCISTHRLEGIWGTLVDGELRVPDAGLDAGPPDGSRGDYALPQVPAVWTVGVNETIIRGP
ncbi:MAG: hypothetical protein JRH20_15195 [Deltaproteobacteria bacterium]|nr:hypothetical protein [Deltaproteobacteria bacterium]